MMQLLYHFRIRAYFFLQLTWNYTLDVGEFDNDDFYSLDVDEFHNDDLFEIAYGLASVCDYNFR